MADQAQLLWACVSKVEGMGRDTLLYQGPLTSPGQDAIARWGTGKYPLVSPGDGTR